MKQFLSLFLLASQVISPSLSEFSGNLKYILIFFCTIKNFPGSPRFMSNAKRHTVVTGRNETLECTVRGISQHTVGRVHSLYIFDFRGFV